MNSAATTAVDVQYRLRVERAETIHSWIDARKKQEITKCVFYITIPQNLGALNVCKDHRIKRIEEILSKNHVNYRYVDTVSGAWNLDKVWIETDTLDCIVEYCGVYPISWDIEDVVEFEQLEQEGRITVLVHWITDKGHVPNH